MGDVVTLEGEPQMTEQEQPEPLLLVDAIADTNYDQAWSDLRQLPVSIRDMRLQLASFEQRLQSAKIIVDRALREASRIAIGKP